MSGYTVEAAGAIVVFAVLRLFVRLLIHFNLCRVIVSHAATDSVFFAIVWFLMFLGGQSIIS